MKIISIALAAFICLSILGLAVPDSVITGPYNVTFDLGIPKEAYRVEIADPVTKESLSGEISTEYKIELINKTGLTRRATMTLTSYETDQVIPSQDELVKGGKYILVQMDDVYDIDAAGRKIDGHDGAVVTGTMRLSGLDVDMYSGLYFPSSTTSVIIVSFYPWEEGTLQLLKTIHVEENNSTS